MIEKKMKREKPEDFIGWKSGDGKLEVVGIAGKDKWNKPLFKVTCNECSKEYVFKSAKKCNAYYTKVFGLCPTCEEHLSRISLCGIDISPPPELKVTKRLITRVNMF